MSENDEKKRALYEFIGVKICGSISIIPCLLLIIVYIFKQKLTLSMFLNINLCITAIFYSVSGLFPSLEPNEAGTFLCHFQVFLGTTGDISILLWTGTISVIGTISYKYQEYIENNQFKMKLLVTCIIYGIVIIFNIIFQGFGEVTIVKNTKYCWITNMSIKSSFSMLILIIYIINIIANIILIIEVKQIKRNITDNEMLMKKLNKFSCLLWEYIIALILIFLSNIIHYIQNLRAKFNNNVYQELPLVFDVFLQSFNFLKGLIVCFVYTYNEEFYNDLVKLFKCECLKIKRTSVMSVTKSNGGLQVNKSFYNAIDFFERTDSNIEMGI